VKKQLKKRAATGWMDLSQLLTQRYQHAYKPGELTSPNAALALSAYHAGIWLYQNGVGSLPLPVYRQDSDDARTKLRQDPAYRLLNDRPNPALSRPKFWHWVVRSIFQDGNALVQISWAGNGKPLALYPIPASQIEKIWITDKWEKRYRVRDSRNNVTEYEDWEVLHFYRFSDNGLWGVPLLWYAATSLGLHTQIQDSATAYYANAARIPGYFKTDAEMTEEARRNVSEVFSDKHAGARKSGKLPFIDTDIELVSVDMTTAQEAQIVEAMNASVADIARWFGVSPLTLGDVTRGTYSNLAADNTALYQKCLRPVLDDLEAELNYKLFGLASDRYCEFSTEAMLRGSPSEQADIWSKAIASGWNTVDEVRAWQNLPPLPEPEPQPQPQPPQPPQETQDGEQPATVQGDQQQPPTN